MGAISARVPDDLENELEAYLDEENFDRSTAVRKIFAEGLAEWRLDQAHDALDEGTVTVSKGAEIAGRSTWEFARIAQDRDVTWVASGHPEDDLDAL